MGRRASTEQTVALLAIVLPDKLCPDLAAGFGILTSRHALWMGVPSIVIVTNEGSEGDPTSPILTEEPADRGRPCARQRVTGAARGQATRGRR